MLKLIIALGVVLLLPLAATADWHEECAQKIIESHRSGKQVVNPSQTKPDLTVAEAYRVAGVLADELVRQGGPVAGYKAALTGKAAQEKFGVTEPAYGILTQAMVISPGATIKRTDFQRLFLEVEIGLYLGRDINAPLANEKEARDAVEAFAPAVELPDLRFSDMKTVNGPDIIADNAGAAAVIIGPKVNLEPPESVDGIETSLSCNGETINTGKAADAMGGQYKALLWLANSVVERGGALKKGTFVITGATGKMLPGKPGRYKAEYGALGTIEFTVE